LIWSLGITLDVVVPKAGCGMSPFGAQFFVCVTRDTDRVADCQKKLSAKAQSTEIPITFL
jgi:hypothetical protein